MPDSGEPGLASVTPGAVASTSTVMVELVNVLPAASVTTSWRSYEPLGSPPTFHVAWYGALESLPMPAKPPPPVRACHSTDATPEPESVAVAVRLTAPPTVRAVTGRRQQTARVGVVDVRRHGRARTGVASDVRCLRANLVGAVA